MANVNPLDPTFRGYVASTLDALILFESCLNGQLNHVPRRPHDRERQDLIASGNIFIYEEHASGIKRWTDGISWSPSRILHNFLVYRELDKPFPPGEKKRALKKKRPPSVAKTDGVTRPGPSSSTDASSGKEVERALVGSLVDSYSFKTDGLVKKTISINYQGVPHHLVSYYNLNDVQSGRLVTPSKHPLCQNTVPRTELLLSQNFRSPIDEIDYDDRSALSQSIIAMPLPVANFNAISSSSYDAMSPYGFSQTGEQPSSQNQVHSHQMQHQMQPHHHQLQVHFQLEQHAQLSHQTHQAQPQHQLPQLQVQHQLPHHQLSQHQLPHHQLPQHHLQQHQLPNYQLPHHHSQSEHQDQTQTQPQHQHHHQHHQHHHSQHQHQSHQSQHHYQNTYPPHSSYISPATGNSIVSQSSYIHPSHGSYTGVSWAMDEMDKGEHYFDESQTSDEPPWWPDSGNPKTGHGPEENRH